MVLLCSRTIYVNCDSFSFIVLFSFLPIRRTLIPQNYTFPPKKQKKRKYIGYRAQKGATQALFAQVALIIWVSVSRKLLHKILLAIEYVETCVKSFEAVGACAHDAAVD